MGYSAGHPHDSGGSEPLEQVFINLILNARDAIGTKNGIRLCGKKPQQHHLKNHRQFKNRDGFGQRHRTGIPLSDLDKIFEPFYTTKDVGKGNGSGTVDQLRHCPGKQRQYSRRSTTMMAAPLLF